MNKLVEGELGKEGNYELTWKDGKLRLVLGMETKGIDAGIYLDLGAEYFVEKLKKAIPGELDDKVIDMLLLAMK